MKLIKPSVEILSQEEGFSGIYKMIEIAGRTCYKSENKITEDSSIKFVQMLIDRGHTAMLEHGTVYLYLPTHCPITGYKYRDNKYSKYVEIRETEKSSPNIHKYITTNYRVLVENGWLEDLQYQCSPTEYHEKRISVRFICDRGVWNELIRHRVIRKIDEDDYISYSSIGEDGDKFSFAQESTRYCNYSKDKFGNELTFIIPCWILENEFFRDNDFSIETNIKDVFTGGDYSDLYSYFKILQEIENSYFKLLDYKWQPQQARNILPNSLKTELIMTGFVSDWEHFFGLRCAEAAHPQMRELAIPLKDEFKALNLI